jgi:hypothetical protein
MAKDLSRTAEASYKNASFGFKYAQRRAKNERAYGKVWAKDGGKPDE